jgi:putative ABC transport system substrate-binding protein
MTVLVWRSAGARRGVRLNSPPATPTEVPMRQIGLVLLLTLSWFVPLVTEAQQAVKVPRVGFLSDTRQPWEEGFRQGLRELGYVAGQNIRIEYRYGEGKFERLPSLAAELVRLNGDVIVAEGTQAISAAKQSTRVIPIVMAVTADPVGGKRLELLKEILPRLSRVGVLWNAGNPDNAKQLREAESAAHTLGLEIHRIEVRSADAFDRAFSAIISARVGALYPLGDSLFATNRRRIVDFAASNRLALMFTTRQGAEAGALLFRRAATYVDKILKGAKPADLPVEQPTKFELVINRKTAKALGLTIPQMVLLRADQVIE